MEEFKLIDTLVRDPKVGVCNLSIAHYLNMVRNATSSISFLITTHHRNVRNTTSLISKFITLQLF